MRIILLLGLTLCQTRFSFCDDVASTTEAAKPPKPDVYELHVNTDIKYRYATTVISSRVANPADVAQEVGFTFVLPESAYISGFIMEIKGKEYKAYVKEKEKAKQDYDLAVSQGLSAGYVEQKARDSNQFTVSVNVEPQSKVNFNLTYDQLLNRVLGSYKHVVNINPGQVVRDMSVVVNINESSKLTKIEVPELKLDNDVGTGDKKENALAVVTRNDPNSATITWAPTPDQQKEIAKDGINGQLTVEYDVDRENPQEILVEDGYFVHFFAPETLKPLPKHVVFVLDYSGSMIGKKIEQLKEAMATILSDLPAEDFFSLVTFSDYAVPWPYNKNVKNEEPTYYGRKPSDIEVTKNHIVPVTPEKIQLAKEHINTYDDYGGTNIIDGLRTGLQLTKLGKEVNKNAAQNLEPMIVFLTDGQPNVEMYNTEEIIKKVLELNTDEVPIYSLAFGYGADAQFLKKLSLKNNGFHRVIYEAADAAIQLKNFYKEIASPLLSDITFKYVPTQVDEASSTKLKFPSFFNGSEIVVAGKVLPSNKSLDSNETGVLTAKGFVGDTSYPIILHCWTPPVPVEVNHTASRLEKVWAYLTIQQLLDKIDAASNETEVDSAKKEALDLALKYEFVTPLTSLVVVKPNETAAVNAEQVRPGAGPIGGFGGGGQAFASYPMYPIAPMSAVGGGFGGMQTAHAGFGSSMGFGGGFFSGIAGMGGQPGFGGGLFSGIAGMGGQPGFGGGLFSGIAGMGGQPGFGGGYYSSIFKSSNQRPMPMRPATFIPMAYPSTTIKYAVEDLKKGTLDDLPWLYDQTKDNVTFTLPLSSGPANFSLGLNQTDEVFYDCQTLISTGEHGECRHLEHCVLDTFSTGVKQFMSYFCDIEIASKHYIGACCPKTPAAAATPALPVPY